MIGALGSLLDCSGEMVELHNMSKLAAAQRLIRERGGTGLVSGGGETQRRSTTRIGQALGELGVTASGLVDGSGKVSMTWRVAAVDCLVLEIHGRGLGMKVWFGDEGWARAVRDLRIEGDKHGGL
ncbi:hypothetical protein M0R45_019771 [Rubus argutus]|uniref:Uncharacterized protein n=1 Tax=Rubus argutus TaxID=59490 RepID=A0AAW1X6C4_RUBAR